MKIWSYGDSHAAGHELGTKYSDTVGLDYIHQLGYESRRAAKKALGDKKYNNTIKQTWYKDIDYKCNPSLSYAGQLAKMSNKELINRAEPGSSNCLNILKMYKDVDEWHSTDTILFSVATPLRYMPAYDNTVTNYQIHWLPKKIAEILWKYGPHDICVKLQAHGHINTARSMHPNIIILKTQNHEMAVNRILPKINVPLSFTEFTVQNFEIEKCRYPGGHLHEDCHTAYAEYMNNLQDI
jgi:hypothetical protein